MLVQQMTPKQQCTSKFLSAGAQLPNVNKITNRDTVVSASWRKMSPQGETQHNRRTNFRKPLYTSWSDEAMPERWWREYSESSNTVTKFSIRSKDGELIISAKVVLQNRHCSQCVVISLTYFAGRMKECLSVLCYLHTSGDVNWEIANELVILYIYFGSKCSNVKDTARYSIRNQEFGVSGGQEGKPGHISHWTYRPSSVSSVPFGICPNKIQKEEDHDQMTQNLN